MAVRARKPDGSKAAAGQVRTYLAGLAPSSRRMLRQLIAAVRAAAPRSQPAFSYRIPAIALDGRIVVWCAGWSDYVSLYPITAAMARAGGTTATRFRHGKGTLRFALDAPLPKSLITRLVRARVAEMVKT